MMPVPATLTNYLPVLLSSVTNTAPDDSTFETQPEGQVDYLSHNWREEDVWRSWRSMTRQKNAIANGMRLENASWRTWWKQRNKLKTISPETLNWYVSHIMLLCFRQRRSCKASLNDAFPASGLICYDFTVPYRSYLTVLICFSAIRLKDSDVTWLYGPLHVGSDWQQTAHHEPPLPPLQRHDGTDSANGSRAPTPSGKKPILKHRSIIELLSLPASPLFHNDSEEEDMSDSGHHSDDPDHHSRPPIKHTKSDTHISWRSRQFRKDSPPRIIAEGHQLSDAEHHRHLAPTSSSSSNSAGSDQDLSATTGVEGPGGRKEKHISFNTFVEQCIAIEKPKPKRRASTTHFVHDTSFNESSVYSFTSFGWDYTNVLMFVV